MRSSFMSGRLMVFVMMVSSILFAGQPADLKAETANRLGPPNEPGWTYGVVRIGEDRDAIKSLPMTERPYRPLHFYGNTVRRMHYRGTPLPAPRDVVGAGAATVLRK